MGGNSEGGGVKQWTGYRREKSIQATVTASNPGEYHYLNARIDPIPFTIKARGNSDPLPLARITQICIAIL
jgi:hypothetical protein